MSDQPGLSPAENSAPTSTPTPEGTLTWVPLGEALAADPDIVAPPVAAAATSVPTARVARIDPDLADTAAFCETYQVSLGASANCVVVAGRRGGETTYAAVMVLATDRADVNKTIRKHLDVRKVSFADQADAEERTGMSQGGITPVGLPADWLLLIDEKVRDAGLVVIGGGVRGSKILLDAADLVARPQAQVLASPCHDGPT